MLESVSIYDNFAPAPLTNAAYDALQLLVIPPSFFYVSIATLKNGTAVDELSSYLPQQVSAYMVRHLLLLLDLCRSECAARGNGFEIWAGNTIRSSETIYMHVDNDEVLRRGGGEIRCPLVGSIFHLGPKTGLRGGETLFDLEPPVALDSDCFHSAPMERIRETCAAPVLVPQRQGRLILFRGNLRHAVAPIVSCAPDSPRLTLLANLWDRRLLSVQQGVCALTPDEYRVLRHDEAATGVRS